MEKLFDLFYQCSGVSIDTRTVKKGELFIALKGGNFNGNEYASKALATGAKFAVVDEKEYEVDGKVFWVEDALVFLQKLANFHRHKMETPILAITGSNGKTTTKEILNKVLSKKYNTLATKGNLNNHIGVPLTLLSLSESHTFAIVEMGANKPGDIDELCRIADPNFGIISNIGKAHLEGFGSLEGVVKTKTELYRYISDFPTSGSTIFYDIANGYLKENLPENINKVSYNGGDVNGELLGMNPFVELKYQYQNTWSRALETKIIGEYNYLNLLCAACVGEYFKVEKKDIYEALENYSPNNNRSQVKETGRDNVLILDAYNANPSSVNSALMSFAKMETKQRNKKIILGDMLELGDESVLEHEKVINKTKELNLEGIFVGPIYHSILGGQNSFNNKEESVKSLLSESWSSCQILLKGSRGIGLESLEEIL